MMAVSCTKCWKGDPEDDYILVVCALCNYASSRSGNMSSRHAEHDSEVHVWYALENVTTRQDVGPKVAFREMPENVVRLPLHP